MDLVYHYCSNDTFLSIIQNKKLWLSSIEHMNDFMEKKWFYNIFYEEISKRASDGAYQKMLDDIIANSNPLNQFMCCLSKSGDILSQWRAYAGDGTGVSIGFNPKFFDVKFDQRIANNIYVKNSITLNDAEYATKKQIQKVLNDLFENSQEVIDFYRDPNADFAEVHLELQNKIASFGTYINHKSLHYKNPAFLEEQEVRLCYNYCPPHHHDKTKENRPYASFVNSRKFRISNGHLASHFEYDFKTSAVQEIILGPKNKFVTEDIERFLKANKFKHKIDIEKSSASYR